MANEFDLERKLIIAGELARRKRRQKNETKAAGNTQKATEEAKRAGLAEFLEAAGLKHDS